MTQTPPKKIRKSPQQKGWLGPAIIVLVVAAFFSFNNLFSSTYIRAEADTATTSLPATVTVAVPTLPAIDTAAYDRKMLLLANYGTTSATSTASTTPRRPWPVKAPYPLPGAILPFKRIVAYYGNFYSKQMGALGQYPPAEMLSRLNTEVKKWQAADPATPVVPAIHYIVTTAQGSAGADGKYRLRMPAEQIDKAVTLAKQINGLVFLDIQVALSTLSKEIPPLDDYLKLPNVHLGIDPEFSMKTGAKPGTVIGTFDATDVNYAAQYLAKIVRDNHLPPKILIIHRFTNPMLTNYKLIKPLPEVQIVIDMDGWGAAARKVNTYQTFITTQPVQFTGFKLFYKNDLREGGTQIMTPKEVLKLRPQPSYIQYQ